MSKRKETILIEEALAKECRIKRIYGCEEVTIGFPKDLMGNEIVDFMTMDSTGIFRCYEIKVSLPDLKSSAKKSWHGHFNYLVVTHELFQKVADWKAFLSEGVGLLVFRGYSFESKVRAKRKDVSGDMADILKNSMIRSMYFKKEKYKDSANLEKLQELSAEARKWERMFRQEEKRNHDFLTMKTRFQSAMRKLCGKKVFFDVLVEELERREASELLAGLLKIIEELDYDEDLPETRDVLTQSVIKAYEFADKIGIDLDREVREAYRK